MSEGFLRGNKMNKVVVKISRLEGGEGLPLPAYQTEFSAGADVRAAVREDVTIAPGARALIPTGFCVSIPPGYEIQVRPRSGLAMRHGLTILNAPGTIDADYRGEVCILLVNLGEKPYNVKRGERIAQLVLSEVGMMAFKEVPALEDSKRGGGGFGHTGEG